MKQIKLSVLIVAMLCFLIGYFEPANAAVRSKSITKVNTSGNAYAILNTTSESCPFFPNPINPNQGITAVFNSSDPVSSIFVTNVSGGSVFEGNAYLPLFFEGNAYLPVDIIKGYFADMSGVTATRYTFDRLPVGTYIMTAKTNSGVIYTSKFSVAE